ncbi:MAG: NAD-dependent protein deacylase [Clostridiaceae bacterium]|nr:NAD-dependent protein deacylase [Clostridiaceae bacterium]
MDTTETLKAWIHEANRAVFFGGAGVSTESGIPDFRSDSGIYKKKFPYPAETMLSHSFYTDKTEEFFDFYRTVMLYPDAQPNASHKVLAKMERDGHLAACVTQNIDGLHQKAGSKTVYELHGSVLRNYCERCRTFYGLDYIIKSKGVPKCAKCGATVKPDVVLYEDSLDTDTVSGAVAAMRKADLLIVGGTSLAVYPAAGLIDAYRGQRLVLINLQPTPYDSRADLVIHDKLGAVLTAAYGEA